MIIVLFHAVPEHEPRITPSKESTCLRFFSREELEKIEIVNTHKDLVEYWKQLAK